MSRSGDDNYWATPPPSVHSYGPTGNGYSPSMMDDYGPGLLIGMLLLTVVVLVFGTGFLLMGTNVGSLCGGG